MILFPIVAFSQKTEKEVSKAELAKREKAQRQSQAFAYQGYQAGKAHKLKRPYNSTKKLLETILPMNRHAITWL